MPDDYSDLGYGDDYLSTENFWTDTLLNYPMPAELEGTEHFHYQIHGRGNTYNSVIDKGILHKTPMPWDEEEEDEGGHGRTYEFSHPDIRRGGDSTAPPPVDEADLTWEHFPLVSAPADAEALADRQAEQEGAET